MIKIAKFAPLGVAAAVLLSGCLGSSTQDTGPCANARTAASAQECGGLSALISRAKTEGALNVIALPREWVDFGALIDGFHAKYGINVVSTNPNASSPDEIRAVQQLGRSRSAPDVLDLSTDVAAANSDLFAPYKVQTWTDIYDNQKEPSGLWAHDYGGYMAVGYDSAKVPTITALEDLMGPAFRGKVALKGNPAQIDAALYGVMMINLYERGSLVDISMGVDFFHRLKAAGNFLPVSATLATVKSGSTPVVLDWEYMSVPHTSDIPTWRTFVPRYPTLGGFFAQAINKDAPHPAAARLWEEYLYSDQGQTVLMQGGARPVRRDVLQVPLADQQIPRAAAPPILMSSGQVAAARKYLEQHWSAAIS